MMNIRQIAQTAPNYCEINREERNLAAILFAALCKPGNAEQFLKSCPRGFNEQLGPDFGIYFEYAYLRDLWNTITDAAIKKEIIRQHLKIPRIDAILNLSVGEINQMFVSRPISNTEIQSPARWSIATYAKHFSVAGDFLKICRFKWAFNIKPDVVIQLDKNRALCIEAKHESGEGSYPASNHEREIFKTRGIPCVRQLELQKYMMEKLLGIKTDFVFLVSKKQKQRDTHAAMTWREAFQCVDMSDMPPFVKEMARRAC